jgi:hypothetical protein
MPAKISRITRGPCSSFESCVISANVASSRSAGGSPTGWNGRPEPTTVSRALPGAATSTSSPLRTKALTNGISGPMCPAPGLVVTRIRIVEVTLRSRAAFPGAGRFPLLRDVLRRSRRLDA